MNKLLISSILAVLMCVSAAFAVSTTVINGVVYSGAGSESPPVTGVQVDVTCGVQTLSDLTDGSGNYMVIFTDDVCPIGSNAQACVGSNCVTLPVITSVTRFNLLEIALFDVPEFGTIAAGVAIAGLSTGYFFMRRNRK